MVSQPCGACRRQAPVSVLATVRSVLDHQIRNLCPACIEHKAEALPALVHTVNKAGWRDLPEDVRRSVRVWDIDAYVSVPIWAERMSQRQLVLSAPSAALPPDREDEVLLQRVRKKREELTPPRYQRGDRRKPKAKRSPPAKRWLSRTR